MPIVLPNGHYFGILCAVDPLPAKVSDPKVVSMFEDFAKLIAYKFSEQLPQDQEGTALLDERAVSELREQFIAILGRDLRNPLQALFATCDLLARRHNDDWSLALVSRMNASRRKSTLIDDALDFARARLGSGIGVQIQPADNIDKALMEIVKELQDARPERTIIADIPVHLTVSCDVGRIQQVAANLLSNALTHGLPASPVRLNAIADDRQLVIDIWNDGGPIPAESLSNIFLPFWRRTTSANRDRFCLGLHICSEIVRAHRGQRSVTSTREAGTQFTVRIPRGETSSCNRIGKSSSLPNGAWYE